jgi:hypothetical protein
MPIKETLQVVLIKIIPLVKQYINFKVAITEMCPYKPVVEPIFNYVISDCLKPRIPLLLKFSRIKSVKGKLSPYF